MKIIKQFIKIILILLFFKKKKYFKLNNFLKNGNSYTQLNDYLNKFLTLKKYSSEVNKILIKKERKNILNFLSKTINKKIYKINTIFFTNKLRFGNFLVTFNKIIFYCEIIGCKNIILDKKKAFIIKNKIYIKKLNITISIKNIKFKKFFKFFYNKNSILYSMFIFKPEIRLNLIRNEIIKNLNKVKISINDLYIHIRSGDIFKKKNLNRYYSQPPLCFYQSILNNYKFKQIHIISSYKNNPVISKLINEYPNIKYSSNPILYDISVLINAYNIVNSISSFLNSILQFNYNIKFLWDYNIYQISEKILLYHYDLYKFPHLNFTIFRMEPSNNYKKEMFNWKNKKKQRKLMIKEICNNYFNIINKEI